MPHTYRPPSPPTRPPLPRVAAALLLAAALVLLAPAATPVRAATPQQVDEAIKKAKAYLRKQQKPDGSWEPTPPRDDQAGGNTAIATLALLAGGDSPQDEHVRKGVRWLMNAKMTGIYALGLRAQVWPYLKLDNDVRAAIRRDYELLLKACQKDTGRFAYTTNTGKDAFFHNSPTQYGVLGLWACARTGVVEVPPGFWQASERGWFACQAPDGAWAYHSVPPSTPENRPTASMTVAGLASLFIAQDYLRANDGVKCAGNVTNPRIELGIKWISQHFDPNWDDGYLLYGIERTGVASGYKYFGPHDWYAAGSATLVKKQSADGSWNYEGERNLRIPGTAFGIFFLSRGRAPIVLNKLQYTFEPPKGRSRPGPKDVANWNQRPRDAANLVHWMGSRMERDLNWQIVNLSAGNPADLLDAPLLYIAGDQQLRLSAADKAKLKGYVEAGGIILGQADCGNAGFANSFKALGRELFPAFDFRVLPPSHPAFTEQYDARKWKGKIAVEGMSNDVRELMILIPREDLSRSWQTQASESKEHHFAVASNIFLYAVDKSNLRYKGETYIITPDPKITPRRTIKVARLRYGGNWDPEPGGWRRLAAHLLNEFKLGLTVDTVRLGSSAATDDVAASAAPGESSDRRPPAPPAAKDASKRAGAANKAGDDVEDGPAVTSLKGYDVVHLTGTGKFRLNDTARAEVKKFVEGGGTLLVDAAGGQTAFADAAQAELEAIFGAEAAGQLARPLPPDHPMYKLPASNVSDVSYRVFARDQLGKGLRTPRLRAITLGAGDKARAAVIVSKEDLTAGMVGQPVGGVFGYEPKSATQLVTNVVLYATGEGNAAPASRPATQPAEKKDEKASGEKAAAKQ